jgi:hypothetical protein
MRVPADFREALLIVALFFAEALFLEEAVLFEEVIFLLAAP